MNKEQYKYKKENNCRKCRELMHTVFVSGKDTFEEHYIGGGGKEIGLKFCNNENCEDFRILKVKLTDINKT